MTNDHSQLSEKITPALPPGSEKVKEKWLAILEISEGMGDRMADAR